MISRGIRQDAVPWLVCNRQAIIGDYDFDYLILTIHVVFSNDRMLRKILNKKVTWR